MIDFIFDPLWWFCIGIPLMCLALLLYIAPYIYGFWYGKGNSLHDIEKSLRKSLEGK